MNGNDIKELTSEQESILERNLVWVLGFPRSGTTWFGIQLLSHQTKSINELRLLYHLSILDTGFFPKSIRVMDVHQENPNYFFSKKSKKTWIYFLRKFILNRIYWHHSDLTNKIIIKEPSSFPSSDIISECLPNSKIIILIRDGRDVIDSIVDAHSSRGFMTEDGRKSINPKGKLKFIKRHSIFWVSTIEDLLKTNSSHAKNNVYLIRYEDLRQNTLEELKKVYDFLEIKISDTTLNDLVSKNSFENIPPELKGTGKFARSATPGKWKENFNGEEKELMQNIMGSTLSKLGYTVE